jgi:hypothetical protein
LLEAFSVITTLRVARSDVYTRVQKSLHIVFVWAVPLAGVGVVLLVMMSDRMTQNRGAARTPATSMHTRVRTATVKAGVITVHRVTAVMPERVVTEAHDADNF